MKVTKKNEIDTCIYNSTVVKRCLLLRWYLKVERYKVRIMEEAILQYEGIGKGITNNFATIQES